MSGEGRVDMDEQGAEHESAQFVADHTGLELRRVARILNLGEPWPIITALDKLFRGSFSDAKAAGVPWETALNARSALVQMDLEASGFEAIELHIGRTALLTGETQETIKAVEAALHAYLRSEFFEFKQALRGKADSPNESS